MKHRLHLVAILMVATFLSPAAEAQLQVTSCGQLRWTPMHLVDSVFRGGGVNISNVTFNGLSDTISCNAVGMFTTGATPTNLGIGSGIIISNGNVASAMGANHGEMTSPTGCSSYSDAQMSSIASGSINDCSVLEFDFTPCSDSIQFRFVFASDEYPNYVCCNSPDVFGFFLSSNDGTDPLQYSNSNIALIPNSSIPIGINTINGGAYGALVGASLCVLTNTQYYVDNAGGSSIEFNGFTTVLTAKALVTPYRSYHIKIGIADGGDANINSAVFLEAGSMTSFPLNPTTVIETVTACNSYTWHGHTFTASTDTATYTTTNVAGCDSVVTLHLTINQCSNENTACDTTISRVCTTGQTLTYLLNCDTTATITGYTGTCSGALTIPDAVQYNGITYPVTTIGNNAFYDNTLLTSLVIGNNVATIGLGAFDGCSGLTGTLTIPGSVTTINNYAFANCSGLTGALTIPNSVTFIGLYAFHGCSGFTSLTIGSSVATIDEFAFEACSGLTGAITLPSSVREIRTGAFYGCSGLTSLTVPDSITTIGDMVFYGCSGLASVTSLDTVPPTTQGNDVFTGVTSTIPLYVPCGSQAAYSTANNWSYFSNLQCASGASIVCDTTISRVCTTGQTLNYYLNCDTTATLTGRTGTYPGALTIPDTVMCNGIIYPVTIIGPRAFLGCGFLTGTLTIGNHVTSIGSDAFNNCHRLTGTLTIPNSVTSIGDGAFMGCSSFTGTLSIPNSVTSIGNSAFRWCSGFTGTLTIPNSVTSIGNEAFWDCSGFSGMLNIPNSVISIGYNPFVGCSGFTSIVVQNGNSVYDSRNNCNAIIETASNTLVSGFNNTIIPNSITSIGDYAFNGCSGLTGSLTIPDSVTSIGYEAFGGCSGFTGSLTIPSSVSFLNSGAFMGCSGFTSVTSFATAPPYSGASVFYGFPDTIPVYVPCGSQAAYRDAIYWNVWNYFSNIQGLYDNDSTETVTACDTFAWHGNIYTASRTVQDTLTNAAGCDSIVTLHLTIQQRLDSVMDTAACDVFRWAVNTQIYDNTGIYRDSVYHGVCWDRYTVNLTLNNSIHSRYILSVCDSVRWHGDLYTTSARYLRYDTVASGCINSDTLYLTVKHSTTSSETATACNVYVWHNRALTASTDTATYRTTNAAGCDSTVTLNLTINQCNTTDITACDTFTWNGTLYTQSGTYIHGNDTLHLTVNYSTATTVTDTACNSYIWHNTTYTTSTATATYTTTNVAGCDSVVTLHLTVNHDSSTTVNASASSTYTWHNTVYTSSGTYTYNYTTVHGCNGEERLHLTILTPDTLPSNVPTSGLIAYYPFDNSPYDASGNGNHGTLLGDNVVPTPAADRNGNANSCYQFGGVDNPNWIKVANSNSLHLDTALSVSYWMSECERRGMDGWGRPATMDFGLTIVAKGGDGIATPVGFEVMRGYNLTNGFEASFSNRSQAYHDNFNHVVPMTNYQLCDWVHCVVVKDGRRTQIWQNGELVLDTVDTQIANFSGANSQDMFIAIMGIGSGIGGGRNYWYPNNGKLDDIGLWNRALTPDEIQSLYGTQLPPPVVNFTVRAASANSAMGSASVVGNSTVQQGAQGTVQAIANSGYRFVRWSDGSTANPYTFTITQDTLLTAYFEGNSYTVTVVNGNPGRGMVSGSGTATYGSRRNISAAPNYGYTFSNWSDGDSNAHRTITVTADITLTAYFGVRQFHIGVAPANYAQGTVTGSGDYDYMSTVTIQATPANGYEFAQWSDGDTLNPRRITVMRDSIFTATFREVPVIPSYTVTATSANTAMGSVTGGGSYEDGTVATLTARANDGYEFVQWNDGVTANPRNITVLSDTAFTATFREVYVQHSYTVSVLSNDGTLGRVSGGGIYSEGAAVHIAAYPLSHCRFVRWSDGVTEQYRTFTAERDISLIAFFARDSVNITARANDDRMGRVTGGGSYAYGSSATLTATPLSGYRFLRWSTGERTTSITVTVRNATSYTAFFESTTQGVDEADGESIRVWSHGLTIHVAGLTGEPLKVYDLTGRLVAERTAAHGDMVIPVTNPGLYLVQTGTTTHKVLTR